MNLYQIDNAIKEVIENGFKIDEETGEVLFDTTNLEELQESLTTKMNNIIGYVKDLDIQAENLKKVADDFSERAKRVSKRSEKLKEYLSSYLQANDMMDRQEFTNGTTSFRKSSVLNIVNEDELVKYLKNSRKYKDLLTEEVEYKIDKRGIKAKIQDGEEIPQCEIIEKNNLQIK